MEFYIRVGRNLNDPRFTDEEKDSQRGSNESTATSMISDETRFHDELSRAPSLQKADSYLKLKLGVR